MTVPALIARGRNLAEALMVDTVSIARPGDPDPLTGRPTMTNVYAGKAKVQTYQAQEARPEAGGHVYTVQRYAVHVPVGAYSPAVGDVVTVTVGTLDPLLADRTFRVVALLHKSMATAYRLAVEEVVA